MSAADLTLTDLERTLLRLLQTAPATAAELNSLLRITPAEIEKVRAALRSLCDQLLIDVTYYDSDQDGEFGLTARGWTALAVDGSRLGRSAA